jgi:hypothetical protein
MDENIGKYVIVRTYAAGVFAGTLVEQKGRTAVMVAARRLWKWVGAASLSQLAMSGTTDPEDCKFPVPVERVKLFQVIEILNVTDIARKSIESVLVWSA